MTITAMCALLAPPEPSLWWGRMDTGDQRIGTQEEPGMWSHVAQRDGDVPHRCSVYSMLKLAIRHLSSTHSTVATASGDLLQTLVKMSLFYGAVLDVLQGHVQAMSQPWLLLGDVPQSIKHSVRDSILESCLLGVLRCMQSMVTAAQDVLAMMSGSAIVEALHLADFVLHGAGMSTEESDTYINRPLFRSSFKTQCLFMTSISNLLPPPGHIFQPSSVLTGAATALLTSFVSHSGTWCESLASCISDAEADLFAVDCTGRMRSTQQVADAKPAESRAGKDAARGSLGQSAGSQQRQAGTALGMMATAGLCRLQAPLYPPSCFLLQWIKNMSKQPAMGALTMRCVAEALRSGRAGIETGSAIIQTGAGVMLCALQAAAPCAAMGMRIGQQGKARCEIVLAADCLAVAVAEWMQEQLRQPCLQLCLRNTVHQWRHSVIWPALGVLSCGKPSGQTTRAGEATMQRARHHSMAVSVSLAILSSTSRYAQTVFNCAEGVWKLQEAAQQCVILVQWSLAELPSGHASTSMYVQAMVCLFDIAVAVRHGNRASGGSEPACESMPRVEASEHSQGELLWHSLAELCLRELMTVNNLATCMHVLSPILGRVMHMLQMHHSCPAEIHELLATRMELLECLDVQYSAQVIDDANACERACVAGSEVDVCGDALPAFTHKSSRGVDSGLSQDMEHTMVWIERFSGEICRLDIATVHESTDAVWAIADVLSATCQTGGSGNVMMHVKAMLRLYCQ
eukprot:jgi/Ulvmu1/4465/UM002_0190.1